MATVSFQHVSKSYGDLEVIPDISLDIHDGEFLVLVGPSGCGKTTTLRMLAGLEEVSKGTIKIDSSNVTRLRPGLRDCAMVFQNYALYPHMSVSNNIAYGMKVRKLDAGEIESRLNNAAELLGLMPLMDRKPKTLSGGQRQRVAIGRAIVRNPKVFLFDEPLSNLDAKLRVEMRTEIRQLQRRLGTTAVYVTHDQTEAMTMADRVVVMNEGRIEQVAEPIELYEKPKNLFVAKFIGAPAMNVFKARIEGNSLNVGNTLLPIAGKDVRRLGSSSDEVLLGVRPEHMRASDVQGTLSVTPTALEPLGPHTILIGHCANTRISAQVAPYFTAQVGTACDIPVDMQQVHYFDSKTLERI